MICWHYIGYRNIKVLSNVSILKYKFRVTILYYKPGKAFRYYTFAEAELWLIYFIDMGKWYSRHLYFYSCTISLSITEKLINTVAISTNSYNSYRNCLAAVSYSLFNCILQSTTARYSHTCYSYALYVIILEYLG